jgi:hypothetical protein
MTGVTGRKRRKKKGPCKAWLIRRLYNWNDKRRGGFLFAIAPNGSTPQSVTRTRAKNSRRSMTAAAYRCLSHPRAANGGSSGSGSPVRKKTWCVASIRTCRLPTPAMSEAAINAALRRLGYDTRTE